MAFSLSFAFPYKLLPQSDFFGGQIVWIEFARFQRHRTKLNWSAQKYFPRAIQILKGMPMKANTCLGTEQQQQLDPAVSNVFRLVITNICPSNFIHTKYWNCHCCFHILNILWLVFLFLPTWWTRAIGSEAFQWIRERSTKDGLMRNWWGEVGEPFAEVYQTAKYPSAKSNKDLIHYLCNRVWMIAGRCVCHHYHLLGLTFLSFLRSHKQDTGGDYKYEVEWCRAD